MSTFSLQVGDVRLTRVGYIDIEIAPEAVELTADEVAAIPWAEPVWAANGQPRVGAAAWVIESGEARVVVDPGCTADDILRGDDAAVHQEAFAGLLAAAGFPRESFTHAVASHLEGVGMFGWRTADGWEKFFPNATLMFSQRELDWLDTVGADDEFIPMGFDAVAELRAKGAVNGSADGETLAPGVRVEITGGHSPGHQVVRIESGGERAVFVGHLSVVVPLHLDTEPLRQQMFPAEAAPVLREIRDEGALLIGPLWPEPGAGYWRDGALVPAPAAG